MINKNQFTLSNQRNTLKFKQYQQQSQKYISNETLKQHLNIGHWNQRQNMKYIMFVQFFQEKFTKKQNRRLWKIFKIMSMFIKSRTSNQCRSHHQKMEKHCKSISNIIQNFKNLYPSLQTVSQNYKKNLQKLNQIINCPLIKDFDALKDIPSQQNLNKEGELMKKLTTQQQLKKKQQRINAGEIRSKKQKKLTIQLMLEKQQQNNQYQDKDQMQVKNNFQHKYSTQKNQCLVQQKYAFPTLNTFQTLRSVLEVPQEFITRNRLQFPPPISQITPNSWQLYYYQLQCLNQNPNLYYNASNWNQFQFGWNK